MAELPDALFATLAAAVETAWGEVEALTDPDYDMADAIVPDRVWRALEEREAMARVIQRIARACPPDRRRRLGQMCREELADSRWRAFDWVRLGNLPVLDEVSTQLEAAWEDLRRAALVDGHVRDALNLNGVRC